MFNLCVNVWFNFHRQTPPKKGTLNSRINFPLCDFNTQRWKMVTFWHFHEKYEQVFGFREKISSTQRRMKIFNLPGSMMSPRAWLRLQTDRDYCTTKLRVTVSSTPPRLYALRSTILDYRERISRTRSRLLLFVGKT